MVNPRTKGVLRFNCRSNNKDENFEDIPANVHLFGKVDTHCCCIWALRKTSSNSIVKIVYRAEEVITESFQMDDYLDSFHTVWKAVNMLNNVTKCPKGGSNPSEKINRLRLWWHINWESTRSFIKSRYRCDTNQSNRKECFIKWMSNLKFREISIWFFRNISSNHPGTI